MAVTCQGRKEGSKEAHSYPCGLDAHLRKCSGWQASGQLVHDDDDENDEREVVYGPTQSGWGERAAARVHPLLHQQLSAPAL